MRQRKQVPENPVETIGRIVLDKDSCLMNRQFVRVGMILGINEAARAFGINAGQLTRWIKKGHVQGHPHYGVNVASLKCYLENTRPRPRSRVLGNKPSTYERWTDDADDLIVMQCDDCGRMFNALRPCVCIFCKGDAHKLRFATKKDREVRD